jgi:Cu/Ag efflux protein CusF
VAFDVEKGTITFKDESGKSVTWPIEVRLIEHARAYAQMRLQTLKAGDRVAVIYVGSAGEERVYDVRPFRPRQRPDGQDQPAAAPSPAPPQ